MRKGAKDQNTSKKNGANDLPPGDEELLEPVSAGLTENVNRVRAALGHSADLRVREFQVGNTPGVRAAVIFVDGMIDSQMVSQHLIEPLMSEISDDRASGSSTAISALKDRVITFSELEEVTDLRQVYLALFSGKIVLFLDEHSVAIVASCFGVSSRGVEEPSSQTVIRGPKEGFTENVRINTALLRRKIKSPNLWLEEKCIGRVTQTTVAIMYIHGLADNNVIAELHRRLDRIDIDSILESGYIEELIQDGRSPFPTIFNSERPDTIAASLLEGKIAVLVDGTPFVLVLPVTLAHFFQSSEDYYQRYDIATFLRLMRIAAFFISLILPSLYIAITTYHQEMLPPTLLISLAAQREGVPFPAAVEAFTMELTFEVLREAGVRMPRAVGQAVSVVGALVLGQAAVQAGLVSAAMVIVVSFTAISSFVIPSFNVAIAARLLRFPLMILAATLGFFGIVVGIIVLMLHLGGLESFGIPYLLPMAPFNKNNQKDVLVRAPWWAMITRPEGLTRRNRYRQRPHSSPSSSDQES